MEAMPPPSPLARRSWPSASASGSGRPAATARGPRLPRALAVVALTIITAAAVAPLAGKGERGRMCCSLLNQQNRCGS